MVSPIICNAIVYSSILALLSIGLTLTYMTTRVPNFAHASFAIVGSYVTWTVVEHSLLSKINALINAGVSRSELILSIQKFTIGVNDYVMFIVISFIVSGLVAAIQYILVLKPLKDRGCNLIGLMIATLAFDLLVVAGVNIYADVMERKFNDFLNILNKKASFMLPVLISSRDFTFMSYDMLKSGLHKVVIASPVITAIVLITLALVLVKTRFGVALRASIENPLLASVLGVDINKMYLASWFICGGIAGIAGSLIPMEFLTNPTLGEVLIVSIFAASVVGGLDSLYGALMGGALVGLSETLGMNALVTYFGVNPGYKPIIPLAIIAATLLFFPEGIAGFINTKILKR